jgi:uncharacterized protein YciI
MFIVFLKFSANKAAAPQFMEGHKSWIQKGLDDGVFLVVGSLKPEGGGAILAHGTDLPALRARVNDDPFVAEDVVRPEIAEFAPNRTDARLDFLLG